MPKKNILIDSEPIEKKEKDEEKAVEESKEFQNEGKKLFSSSKSEGTRLY